jgi:hypothetical protein
MVFAMATYIESVPVAVEIVHNADEAGEGEAEECYVPCLCLPGFFPLYDIVEISV